MGAPINSRRAGRNKPEGGGRLPGVLEGKRAFLSMSVMHIIGDIHGHFDQLIALLRDDAHLIDADGHWIGGDATVCFLGDYFDRGPDGVGTVELIMQMEQAAAAAGGRVIALLGNHDLMIMAAHRFGHAQTAGPAGNFVADWYRVGGITSDIDRLMSEHIMWLMTRPAMVLLGDRLLMHADATFYLRFGRSVDKVNAGFRELLRSTDTAQWDRALDDFSHRFAFTPVDYFGDPQPRGLIRARDFLGILGGKQIIHGHTPIFRMAGLLPEDVREAYIYAQGMCVNLDPGMYQGGPGFVYRANGS